MIDWGEEGSPWRNLNEQADLFDKTVKYRCEQESIEPYRRNDNKSF